MEDIVGIVKSRGGAVKDTRKDPRFACCHSPGKAPICWAEIDLGPIQLDVLEILLRVEPSIDAEAA